MKGYPLKYFNEDGEVLGGQTVIFKGKQYTTGNRRHFIVELWKEKKFVQCVEQKELKIVRT